MRIPRATYRLQLNDDFTLHDAHDILRYLVRLGISDLYLSPIFSGFQLALSYVPSSDKETHGDGVGAHLGMPTNIDGTSRHNVSAYGVYNYEAENWWLQIGAGGSWEGNVEQTVGPDREESDFYQTGILLGFGDFQVGAVYNYFNDDDLFGTMPRMPYWTFVGYRGNACGGANGMPFCSAGVCGITCATGWANCNGSPTDGCEVHTSVDNSHCGACGNICFGATVCSGGVCVTP